MEVIGQDPVEMVVKGKNKKGSYLTKRAYSLTWVITHLPKFSCEMATIHRKILGPLNLASILEGFGVAAYSSHNKGLLVVLSKNHDFNPQLGKFPLAWRSTVKFSNWAKLWCRWDSKLSFFERRWQNFGN